MIPRSKTLHREKAAPALMKRFQFRNVHQVPTLKRICINVGVGDASENSGVLEDAVKTLSSITRQKAVVTKSKKAISNFKVKEGQAIGCRVSLSGNRMWEFFDRFVTLAIPRIRDFRGLSRRSMDGRGNYTLGLKEQIVFHEIDNDKIKRIHGMDITIVTSARTDAEGLALLEEMGMPFRKEKDKSEKDKGGN